jgi:hypothetical protein
MLIAVALTVGVGPAYALESVATSLPVIDGRIYEQEWTGAKTLDHFFTVVPKTGQQNEDSTIVYVKQSSDALYFAFKFHPRSKVIRQSLIRDQSSEEENEFFIVLDLENKNQNGYIFIFNFINNQRDMAVYNQRNIAFEWDWVWQCRSVVYKEPTADQNGYIETEARIPVDKIQNKSQDQIGIDLQLFAYKPDGSSYFYALTPESEILTVKSTYKLDIEPFEESFTLEVTAIPFVVGQRIQSTATTGTLGGDLNLSLDKHKLKATINTDESTLEADPFQFSLYGQSIFLQEKRPFLSKDLDIYRMPINMFYTRAIQDIRWGANYTFRSNEVKAGLVSVEDELDSDHDGRRERRHLTVGRSTWQGGDLNFGTTVLYGRNFDTKAVERAVSLDSRIELPLGFRFQPQWMANADGNAYQLQVARPRDWAGGFYGSAVYRTFGYGFDVSTLFNNYGTEYHERALELGFRSVSNRQLFSQLEFNTEYYKAATLATGFIYQEYGALYVSNLLLENLQLAHRIEVNRPEEPTAAGVITHRNMLQDHSAKLILGAQAITFGYNFGPYFGTYLKNPYANARIILWDRLACDLSLNHRSYAGVRQTIVRVKLDVRLLERLYLRSFVQKDDYRKLGLWNTLLQYEFFAGSSVYLVLNQVGERFEQSGQFFKVGYEVNL